MRQRKPKPPMFMGEPSPAIAAIQKMNMAALNVRIQRLTDEIERLQQKTQRLHAIAPLQQEQLPGLKTLTDRLIKLREAAVDRLAVKEERKRQFEANGGISGQHSPRPRNDKHAGGGNSSTGGYRRG